MPKKSLGKRLEAIGKKAVAQLQHRAEETSQALNNLAVTLALHKERNQSKDIANNISNQVVASFDLQKEAQQSVNSLSATFNALSKRSQELKGNQEVLTQLEQVKKELALCNAALFTLTYEHNSIISQNFVDQANAQCALITNAPKETASKDKEGKPEDYSKEASEKVAEEALKALEALESAVLKQMNEVQRHADFIKTTKESLEKTLKEINDKIFILETVQAAPVSSVLSRDLDLAQQMQKQLQEAHAEIARLRAAAGLGAISAASAVPGATFTAQAEGSRAVPLASAVPSVPAEERKASVAP